VTRSARADGVGSANVWRLLSFSRPYLGRVLVTVVFSLLYAGGLTGRAYLVKPLFDDVLTPAQFSASGLWERISGGQSAQPPAAAEQTERERAALEARVRESFWKLAGIGLGLVFFLPLLHWVRDYTGEWVMTRMAVDMQIRLGEKLLRLPLSHHTRSRRGDAVARVTNDTIVANRAQSLVFGEAIQDVAVVLLALTWSVVISWQLALTLLVVGPPLALVLSVFGRRIRFSAHRRQQQVTELMQRLLQILGGIRVIKAFGAEDLERAAYRREALLYFRRALKVVRTRVLSRSIVELLGQAASVGPLVIGLLAVINHWWGMTVGDLLAFSVVSAMTYRPTKNLMRLWNAVQDALPAAARIFEMLDMAEEVPDRPGARALERVERGIRYRGVHFSYGREPVLRGVDLEIRAGEVVALVGRTGAGKSTLADLLLRFHDPQQGSVEIDGVDLRDIRRESLRQLVSVVSQDPFLFDTTLLENIRYGRPEATLDDAMEAARAAHASEFIEKLPLGYDTPAGDLGAQLSGGQRQRITIARALMRDPQILIFDEATSALDAKAEQAVQDAIRNLMKGRTVLVIAHRLSTVQSADRIAVLEGGRIAAIGPHAEVLAQSELYQELVRLQLGRE
jgi:subfamily B ATP-binding cassette protein MsbA